MERIKNNCAEGLEGINLGMDPEDLRPLAWMRFVFICLIIINMLGLSTLTATVMGP
jgi:hypothetical protein